MGSHQAQGYREICAYQVHLVQYLVYYNTSTIDSTSTSTFPDLFCGHFFFRTKKKPQLSLDKKQKNNYNHSLTLLHNNTTTMTVFQMTTMLCLFAVSSTHGATYPADILGLSHSKWTLQIPVQRSTSNESLGGIKEISGTELLTYSSEYFKAGQDSTGPSVIMWAPENGYKTPNGAGARTELSEDHEFGFSGTHEFNFTQKVTEADPTGDVVIGQIKGDSGNDCLLVVELTYNSIAHRVTVHTFDKNCKHNIEALGSFKMAEPIQISFRVDNFNVHVATNKGTASYDYSYFGSNYKMHFKAGAYNSKSGSDSSKGGRTHLSHLSVAHS